MEHVSPTGWVEIGLQALALLGVVPAVRRWLSSGRRARTASLVAQLAQEVLVAVARRKGVSPDAVHELEEAVELLRRRLIEVGVDPAKASAIAREALAGAVHPAQPAWQPPPTCHSCAPPRSALEAAGQEELPFEPPSQ